MALYEVPLKITGRYLIIKEVSDRPSCAEKSLNFIVRIENIRNFSLF